MKIVAIVSVTLVILAAVLFQAVSMVLDRQSQVAACERSSQEYQALLHSRSPDAARAASYRAGC